VIPVAAKDAKALRAAFLRGVLRALRVTWPILSALLTLMASLGAVVGLLEDWGMGSGIYFAFVTGLTIGYGDLAPSMLITRVLAMAIGFLGIILTGVVAAVAVAALQSETGRQASTD
jgi:hypothetical protein